MRRTVCLILALLAWAGLLLMLLTTQGTAVVPADQVSRLPHWLSAGAPLRAQQPLEVGDSGLYPIVARHPASAHPIHRPGASALLRPMRRIPPLRTTLGVGPPAARCS